MNLSELPSGTWRVAVKFKGERRTATAPTRAQAQLLGAQMEVELGAKRRPETVTVEALLDAHLASVDWSPTTRVDSLAVARALPAVFLNRPVSDVDAALVAALFRELRRDEWSPHRIHRAKMVLSTAWVSTAIPSRWASHNPVRDAKAPKLPHREIDPPDSATVAKLLDAATGPLEVYLRLSAATGARRGELVGLRWADLDLEHRLIRITHSIVWTPGAGMAERDTKTSVKGHRTLSLGARLTMRLVEHRAEQYGAVAGDVAPVWVFSHKGGASPWRPDYITREFARLCKRQDVAGVRLHDLRHHLATDQLARGVPLHKVAKRLGHSSTATTQRIYSHWLNDDEDMADELDDRFG